MQSVQIELSNIQSHEHTMFSLEPGLNFILADDNNVGKSTILKVISAAASMPRTSKDDLIGLLRGGTTQGYARFSIGATQIIFWLFRENATTVRAFFETRIDGDSTRSTSCPEELLRALDIVLGEDGVPVNFNDADSVQLIVEDSHKNDEVLAKVLIDMKIENIRANGVALSKQIAQDYKMLSVKLTDQKALLGSLAFNNSVDAFYQEEDLLCAAVRVADTLIPWVDANEADFSIPYGEVSLIEASVRVYLQLFTLFQEEGQAVVVDDFEELSAALRLLQMLSPVSLQAVSKPVLVRDTTLSNMQRAVDVLQAVTKVQTACQFMQSADGKFKSGTKELVSLNLEASKSFEQVECPVKGKVYYSDEKCIPCGD